LQEREERPARGIGPRDATRHRDGNPRARESRREERGVGLGPPNEDGHAVERHARSGLAERAPRDLHGFAGLAGRGEEHDAAVVRVCARGSVVQGEEPPLQYVEAGASAGQLVLVHEPDIAIDGERAFVARGRRRQRVSRAAHERSEEAGLGRGRRGQVEVNERPSRDGGRRTGFERLGGEREEAPRPAAPAARSCASSTVRSSPAPLGDGAGVRHGQTIPRGGDPERRRKRPAAGRAGKGLEARERPSESSVNAARAVAA
jgi:hypothetical protein